MLYSLLARRGDQTGITATGAFTNGLRIEAIIVASLWINRLPLASLLATGSGWGSSGVRAGMAVLMALQGALMAWRFRQRAGKDLKVLAEPRGV